MAEHKRIVESLRQEYCPPLDEGLFEALRLDYSDLTQPTDLSNLRQTLDQIKRNVQTEEASGFDPSGTSGQEVLENGEKYTSSVSSVEKSSEQDIDSLITGLSDFTWEDGVKSTYTRQSSWDSLSEDKKEECLSQLLPQMTGAAIRFTLRKNHQKFDQSMDELLLLAFLEDDAKHNSNDLEAYAGGSFNGKSRKKKSKKFGKAHLYDSNPPSPNTSTDSLPIKNAWDISKEEIDFIVSRTIVSREKIASLYHASGASLAVTIEALAMEHASSLKQRAPFDPAVELTTTTMASSYPNIPQDKLSGLVILASNNPSAVEDLVVAMTAVSTSSDTRRTTIVPQYIDIQKTLAERSTNTPHVPQAFSSTQTKDPESTQFRAAANRAAGGEAFTQAASAYRRGKSDRHYGGVAAYYSGIGREHMRIARDQSSAAADAIVSSKSTSTTIDLHGVSVKDSVRIASSRTQQWWDNLGDAKHVSGGGGPVRDGFRIITGIGRHSKDGAPKIGPAVTKRLMNDGWRVDIGQGEVWVTGKRRS